MNAVLEKLQAIKAKGKAWYRQLVIDAAKGLDVDEHDVLSACDDTGKSLDDFQKAVRILERRLEAVAWLEQAEGLKPAIAAASKAYVEECDKLQELKNRHEAEIVQAKTEWSKAYSAQSSLAGQQERLRREAIDILKGTSSPDIDESVRQMRSEILDLQNAINSRAVASLPKRSRPGGVIHPADAERMEREYQAAIQALAAANARDEAQIAELENAIQEAHKRQMAAIAFDVI